MSQIHLVKLCVGAPSLQDLLDWEKGRGPIISLTTRNRPVRAQELAEGGSLYWVIKGFIVCRRPIIGFSSIKDGDEEKCLIELENRHIATQTQPRRPFQGWRYLKDCDAPADLIQGDDDGQQNILKALILQGLL
jgi:hypothetical protein